MRCTVEQQSPVVTQWRAINDSISMQGGGATAEVQSIRLADIELES